VKWLEFSVTTDSEAAEAVAELFNRYAQGGAVIELPLDCFEQDLPTSSPPSSVIVKAYLPLDGTAQGNVSTEEAQRHLLRIGQRILIVPAWEAHEPDAGDVVIRLEPGMAFGTGLHPTTRLCLQALETYLATGCTALDVGTGSGVLAIAAAKLGARSVLAIDADPVAVSVAQENVILNAVADRVTLRHGSLPGGATTGWGLMAGGAGSEMYLVETGQFDLVLVNILARVIIGMAPALSARLAPTGQLMAAGLIEDQESEVEAAFQAAGIEIVERTQEQDWVCLVAQRA
jgi:ribosomal protein L11 methyltransferase